MSLIKTVKDLRLRFETRARGTHDIDDTYDILTSARGRIEDMYNLKISEALDVSQIANPGDTYLTAKNLPADWRKTKKMVVDIIPYYPIPFKQRIGYRFSARHYTIDERNKKFYLTGSVAANKVINHFYQVSYTPFSADVENQTIDNTFLAWPYEYWPLLILEAQAEFLGGIDGDDIARVLGAAAAARHERLLDGLLAWDHDLKLQSMGGALGYADQDDRPFDVGLL